MYEIEIFGSVVTTNYYQKAVAVRLHSVSLQCSDNTFLYETPICFPLYDIHFLLYNFEIVKLSKSLGEYTVC